jgi:hypothetical protein
MENMENRAAWHFDKRGIFSVRSAYKVYRKEQVVKSSRGGASSSWPDPGYESLWNKIWNSQCPNKIKHFLWRFCYNSHPLRMNLNRRGMELDTRCVVCHRFNEDGAHLFFKCKVIEKLWNYLGMNKERELLLSKPSARDVLEAIMSLKEEQKLKCCYVLSGCAGPSVIESERDAVWLSHSIQIRMAERKRQETKKVGGTGGTRLSKWERSEQNYIKVNCDATYDVNIGNGGCGCLTRC